MPNGWLTPNSIPTDKICRVLHIPEEYEYIIPAVMGALYPLTLAENWEQFGTVTPQQMAAAMLQMYFSIQNVDCEPVSIPVGAIIQMATTATPAGWLLCDGNEVLKADYPALWDAIVDVWGVATLGSDYFVLPDFRNKSPYGFQSGGGWTKAFGSTHGAETVTLAEDEIPEHHHTLYATNTGGGRQMPLGASLVNINDIPDNDIHTFDTGGGDPHNNLHPVAICGFIIYAGV